MLRRAAHVLCRGIAKIEVSHQVLGFRHIQGDFPFV
jgi:hypothetical protein